MSIEPGAQLRHELRTPLNHIIGYAELLLEELEAGDQPELAADLAALRADARQLLTLLNEVLARGQTGPPDLAAARGTLGPPLDRVRAAGESLHRRAEEEAGDRRIAIQARDCFPLNGSQFVDTSRVECGDSTNFRFSIPRSPAELIQIRFDMYSFLKESARIGRGLIFI